jgi:hypothetical protein
MEKKWMQNTADDSRIKGIFMLSWSLDIGSLTVVMMFVSALLSIVLFLLWQSRKTCPGFGFWTAGNALNTAGFLLMFLRGMIPDILSIVLSNLLVLFSLVLFLEGVRWFRGVAGRMIFSLSLFVFPVLLIPYFTFVIDNIGMRVIIFSAFAAVISGLAAWELIRNAPRICGSPSGLRAAPLQYTPCSWLPELSSRFWARVPTTSSRPA